MYVHIQRETDRKREYVFIYSLPIPTLIRLHEKEFFDVKDSAHKQKTAEKSLKIKKK